MRWPASPVTAGRCGKPRVGERGPSGLVRRLRDHGRALGAVEVDRGERRPQARSLRRHARLRRGVSARGTRPRWWPTSAPSAPPPTVSAGRSQLPPTDRHRQGLSRGRSGAEDARSCPTKARPSWSSSTRTASGPRFQYELEFPIRPTATDEGYGAGVGDIVVSGKYVLGFNPSEAADLLRRVSRSRCPTGNEKQGSRFGHHGVRRPSFAFGKGIRSSVFQSKVAAELPADTNRASKNYQVRDRVFVPAHRFRAHGLRSRPRTDRRVQPEEQEPRADRGDRRFEGAQQTRPRHRVGGHGYSRCGRRARRGRRSSARTSCGTSATGRSGRVGSGATSLRVMESPARVLLSKATRTACVRRGAVRDGRARRPPSHPLPRLRMGAAKRRPLELRVPPLVEHLRHRRRVSLLRSQVDGNAVPEVPRLVAAPRLVRRR